MTCAADADDHSATPCWMDRQIDRSAADVTPCTRTSTTGFYATNPRIAAGHGQAHRPVRARDFRSGRQLEGP